MRIFLGVLSYLLLIISLICIITIKMGVGVLLSKLLSDHICSE